MTHRNRRTFRRICIFFSMCLLPGAIALLAAPFGLTPDWLLVVCVSSAIPVAVSVDEFLERRQEQRLKRSMHPYCLTCGYDLTGNESGTCPECGNRFLNA